MKKTEQSKEIDSLQRIFEQQQSYIKNNPYPSYEERAHQLQQLSALLRLEKEAFCQALTADYGHRSHYDTLISEILATISHAEYTLRHLKHWMKPAYRSPGLHFPGSAKVLYQPLGIVGIMTPWNFPINLSLTPLITAIAAGNNVMLKMSEFTPNTNKLLSTVLSKVFKSQQVALIEGDAKISAYFSSLAFNHLLFTGSTVIGRSVYKAAAANLTPVTLELGGKSPVLIAPDYDITLAVDRIIYGKSLNAGQICVAPDYILLPKEKEASFISAYLKKFKTLYPEGINSKDWTSIINHSHYQRLQDYLEEVALLGAPITPCHGDANHPNVNSEVNDPEKRRMTTHLVNELNFDDDIQLLKEEIFGPILPIIGYTDIESAINYIAGQENPLAIYLMSNDKALQQRISYDLRSGGVCFNDTIMQVTLHDAPFGGVGASGIGHYHGHEGFCRFSHAKTLLKKGRFYTTSLFFPPYGTKWQNRILSFLISKLE